MELCANRGKNIEIDVNGKNYSRYAIKTKFVKRGDSYLDIIEEYIKPIYNEGDIVSISEKMVALCQNRVVRREDIKIGALARFLSKFAAHPDPKVGIGVGSSIKMQYAIDTVGPVRVLFASMASAITKLLGQKGVFYKIVGLEVSGLDGFEVNTLDKGEDASETAAFDNDWAEYLDMGIKTPENPTRVCNEIKEKLGISCMIVDANDVGQDILGCSSDICLSELELKGLIKDNPAGQGRQMTPLILIRQASLVNA